jgi:exosortase/archaeosortase family protein
MRTLHLASYVRSRSNLFLGLKVAAVALLTIAFFYQDLAMVANDALQNESMNYMLVVPFLFAYVLYRKRKMLRVAIAVRNDEQETTHYLPGIIGAFLLATAILFYWHGSYTFTPLSLHMMTLPFFVASLILIFFNSETLRHSFFAIAFLFLLAPPPLETLYSWGATLSVVSSQVSYNLVRLLQIPATLTSESGTPVIQITNSSGTPISFVVDIACSGIYSLLGFLVFAVFTAYIMREKLWKKLGLFLIGFVLIYILNIARITTLLVIGFQFGEQIALQLFHLLGGWILIFVGTLFLLVFAEKIMHAQIFSRSTPGCPNCIQKSETKLDFCLSCGRILAPSPIIFGKSDVAKITAISMVVILILLIQVPALALTKDPMQIMVQTPSGEQGNTQLLPRIDGYEARFLHRDVIFENLSGQDASLMYAYMPLDEKKDLVYVGVEIASTTGPLHPWEYCLAGPGRPAYATKLDLVDIQILENPPIIARYFAFVWEYQLYANQTQVVLYWYHTALFMINDTAQEKWLKISLITYPENIQELTPKEELLPFAIAIAQYWEPLKTWTQIALLLSQYGLMFAIATGMTLAVIVVIFLIKKRQEKIANTHVYQKLSSSAREVIDVVAEIEKETIPTLDAIITKYRRKIGNSETGEMLSRLSELMKTGIVKKEIANVQDEPVCVWKTKMAPNVETNTLQWVELN